MPTTNRLQKLRDSQDNMSQQELAERLGLKHWRTIDRWEKGESSIQEKYWDALSVIFGVSAAHILGLDDENGNGGERKAA